MSGRTEYQYAISCHGIPFVDSEQSELLAQKLDRDMAEVCRLASAILLRRGYQSARLGICYTEAHLYKRQTLSISGRHPKSNAPLIRAYRERVTCPNCGHLQHRFGCDPAHRYDLRHRSEGRTKVSSQ